MQAGVSGYILKQSPSSELIRAIRVVAGGANYLAPAMTGKAFSIMTGKTNQLGAAAGVQLTTRESDALRHIALGYSNKEIAEKMDISVKTVEAHKTNALKKLNMTSRKDIIRYAILQGWMQEN